MKRVKRIFAIVLFIIMIAVVGYTAHTCSRTVAEIEEQGVVLNEEDQN